MVCGNLSTGPFAAAGTALWNTIMPSGLTRICSKPCLHFIYNYALICNCCGIQQHLLSSTGDADAEVKKLMGESAQLSSSQQEAEAHLQHSKEAIQELQAALRNAQVRIALNGMLY